MKGEPLRPVPKPPKQEKKHKGLSRSIGYTKRSDVCYSEIERKITLKPVGKRGKRLSKDDKRMQEYFHNRECVCGCGTKGMWAHLDGRSEDVRHKPALAIPACDILHPGWLDHHPDGVKCKAGMLERALVKGDTLVFEDVEDLLAKYDYTTYRWKELERRRI
jgi:hypothetical protein